MIIQQQQLKEQVEENYTHTKYLDGVLKEKVEVSQSSFILAQVWMNRVKRVPVKCLDCVINISEST